MSFRMKISPPVRLTCSPGSIRKCRPQRLEAQLLAPLTFDVQQIADVAELAVQIAPHGRFVDGAHGKPVRSTSLFIDEATDPPFVAATTITRPRMAGERQRASASGNGFPELRDRRSEGAAVATAAVRRLPQCWGPVPSSCQISGVVGPAKSPANRITFEERTIYCIVSAPITL